MDFDLIGKVTRTKLYFTQSLMPVLEAIVNSIHATLYSEISNGIIEVEIERDKSQEILDLSEGDVRPIKSFLITDNGVGFNEENYKSFSTSETTHKLELGGKGVGRFLWLKAFKSVDISSSFHHNGSFKNRSFKFELVDDGVVDHKLEDTATNERKTSVKLNSFYPDYQKSCPRILDDLSERIMQHCLSYLIKDNCPQIIVKDPANSKEIILNDIYRTNVRKIESKDFSVKKQKFRIDLFKVLNLITQSAVHFCADDREVIAKPLKDDIPELNKRIKSGSEEFYLKVYLSGGYLNEIVNSERTNFDFPESNDMFMEYVSEEELKKNLIPEIEAGIKKYLDEIRENKLERIKQYVYKKAPQYRPLLKYQLHEIEKLPILAEGKLEIELFRLQQKARKGSQGRRKKYFQKNQNSKGF